jgi:hypothetical protein
VIFQLRNISNRELKEQQKISENRINILYFFKMRVVSISKLHSEVEGPKKKLWRQKEKSGKLYRHQNTSASCDMTHITTRILPKHGPMKIEKKCPGCDTCVRVRKTMHTFIPNNKCKIQGCGLIYPTKFQMKCHRYDDHPTFTYKDCKQKFTTQ